MNAVSYGLRRQIQLLVEIRCYLAFGMRLPGGHPSKKDGWEPVREDELVGYRSDIALRVYEEYRRDGFRYADPGITPKAIAQQIQVHIKKRGDLQWQIDSFGNFLFTPTQTYLAQQSRNLSTKQSYEHTPIRQLSEQDRIQRETHYFDYHIPEQITVSELRKIVKMEQRARVIERVNGMRVERGFWGDQRAVGRIAGILLLDRGQFRVGTVEELVKNRRAIKEGEEYQYINCHGEDTIPLQTLLPNHILFNSYLGNEPTPISKLTNSQLQAQLAKPATGLIPKQEPLFHTNRELAMTNLLVIYGNLLDLHRLDLAEQLIQLEKQEQRREILRSHLGSLTRLNFHT